MPGRFAALLLCLLATGCATMVNGRHQTLEVDSYPSGAAVDVDCGEKRESVAVTPARISVLRAASHCSLTLHRPGFETTELRLERQASRAIKLNAAFGVAPAVFLGLAGALVGSVVGGADTGGEIGAKAGFGLGVAGAESIDKEGGGWKWVPGKLFVVLTRTSAESESSQASAGDPENPACEDAVPPGDRRP